MTEILQPLSNVSGCVGVHTKANKSKTLVCLGRSAPHKTCIIYLWRAEKARDGFFINASCGVNKWQTAAKVTLNVKLSPAGSIQKNHLLVGDDWTGEKKNPSCLKLKVLVNSVFHKYSKIGWSICNVPFLWSFTPATCFHWEKYKHARRKEVRSLQTISFLTPSPNSHSLHETIAAVRCCWAHICFTEHHGLFGRSNKTSTNFKKQKSLKLFKITVQLFSLGKTSPEKMCSKRRLVSFAAHNSGANLPQLF